jgi:aminoglycoside 3-N-acetyltransferase
MPERVRSCNPLQSIAAIGQHAEALCGSDSLSGYGVTSPWHRLRILQGKLLFFGVGLQPMTYIHYVEQQYGVPHMYCKVYTTPVVKSGTPIPGNPISAVRYLDYGIEYDLSRFQSLLTSKGILKTAQLGRTTIHAISAQDVFDVAVECLDKDPYFFLKAPPKFIPGKIPFDGATGAQPIETNR